MPTEHDLSAGTDDSSQGQTLHHGWVEISAEHRLYDAAARCPADPHWADAARPIEAATQALVDGLDSPALVSLVVEAEKFQVFLRFPIKEPERLADEILRTLRQPPGRWRATFHSMVAGRRGRPSMAGRRWRSEDVW
ncbi:hypothetical protein ABZX12_17275 [Kribbella sp. NPDC003505]|uniref:hypothetical protein n=1 Tax=Kribbella sp. NPDC003505 TaxID=3154448 RepID=UPI0033BD2EE4